VLAQIAGDEGEYATAMELSNLALAQYEARQDVILTASVKLFQAELACKMGAYTAASAHFQQTCALRQTVKRPLSPREQARYAALEQALSS